MTYIDFFVAAYYFHKGKDFSSVKVILTTCAEPYRNGRLEYNTMKDMLTVGDLKEWIRDRLKGSYLKKFNSIYH